MTTSTLTLGPTPTDTPQSDGTARPGTSQVTPVGAANFMVEEAHCGGCLRKIEREVGALHGVTGVRFNLTTRRLRVEHDGSADVVERVTARLAEIGFPGRAYDPDVLGSADADVEKKLLRAMTVAGFAAANVMLLSVSVWAGSDMGEATRALLHWFSALIVLPAVVYAGRPFFLSAITALAGGRTNMDVPISLAIILASAMSLFETIRGGEHVYFESAVMLLFFLLLGRYLDRRARGKARHAAESLLTLDSTAITVIEADRRGFAAYRRRRRLRPGMTVAGRCWRGASLPMARSCLGPLIGGRHQPDHRRVRAGGARNRRQGLCRHHKSTWQPRSR